MISVEILNRTYEAWTERMFPSPPFVGVGARWDINGWSVSLEAEGVRVTPVAGQPTLLSVETSRWLAQALYDAALVADPRNKELPKARRAKRLVAREVDGVKVHGRWPITKVAPFGWRLPVTEAFALSRALGHVADGLSLPPPGVGLPSCVDQFRRMMPGVDSGD